MALGVVSIEQLVAQQSSAFANWPEAPEKQRPKRLPHMGSVSEADALVLRAKGWEPTDVRLLPNATDAERAVALKACLEGIRFGTIEAEKKNLYKYLELEARALGLTSSRGPSEEKPKDEIANDSLGDIFGKMLDTKPKWLQDTKKNGRPPGSKTSKVSD